MKRIYVFLSIFLAFQLLDVLLTYFGILFAGIGYERNALMRGLIFSYGYWIISLFNIVLNVSIIMGIYYMYNRYENRRKQLEYFAAFICLIPLYGILSSIYVLLSAWV